MPTLRHSGPSPDAKSPRGLTGWVWWVSSNCYFEAWHSFSLASSASFFGCLPGEQKKGSLPCPTLAGLVSHIDARGFLFTSPSIALLPGLLSAQITFLSRMRSSLNLPTRQKNCAYNTSHVLIPAHWEFGLSGCTRRICNDFTLLYPF